MIHHVKQMGETNELLSSETSLVGDRLIKNLDLRLLHLLE